MVDPADPPLGLFTADMAHALNNVTATLYGALDTLEALPASEHSARLGRALASACGKTQALSAANFLLSLPAPWGAPTSVLSTSGLVLDAQAREVLYDALTEAAGVSSEPTDILTLRLKGMADLGRLKALWICAAVLLRRACGEKAELRSHIQLQSPDPDAVLALSLRASIPLPNLEQWLHAKHPCGLALTHALASDWARDLRMTQSGSQLLIHCPILPEGPSSLPGSP